MKTAQPDLFTTLPAAAPALAAANAPVANAAEGQLSDNRPLPKTKLRFLALDDLDRPRNRVKART